MSYIAITADHNKIRKVRRRLRQQGHTTYVAAVVSRHARLKARKLKYRRQVSVLMNYVLIEVPDHPAAFDLWLYGILQTKDVRGFIKLGSQPAFISNPAIGRIRERVAEIVLELKTVRHKKWLRTGAKASIKTGTLAGRTGRIQWTRGHRVGLEAMLFGSMRVIEFEAKNLEAA